MTDDPIAEIEFEVALLARRATMASTYGQLDRSAYLLLCQIAEHGTRGLKALADEFHLDLSTVSRQAAALEAKGYVQRTPDPSDGRASLFTLTPLGRKQLEETRALRRKVYEQLLADWPQADRKRFAALLARMNRTFLR
ncbi:MAG: MarR family transcriptional regulator [Alicyclobacillus sp.]|nr:MarR family transcriptional regulator [Alicyclobacillus sp.]